ncbi:MAG: hypothetical protein M0Z81_11830 [Deltaproteobacteria bacterium]|jgi:hypothetical protein|nr:hypothetical protein [Deltaproteobacteria bacterium]
MSQPKIKRKLTATAKGPSNFVDAGEVCILCGGGPAAVGFYNPDDQGDLKHPEGKRFIFPYLVCLECVEHRFEEVQALVEQEAAQRLQDFTLDTIDIDLDTGVMRHATYTRGPIPGMN